MENTPLTELMDLAAETQSPWALAVLATSHHMYVRMCVAANSNTPTRELRRLGADPRACVRERALHTLRGGL